MLRILRDIVANTNDISLIEASTTTWDVFCRHQDVANLAADSGYRALYEEVVGLYGSLAKNNTKKLGKSTTIVEQHDATRLRKAGVAAVKSIFATTELDRQWNREYDTAFAAVLSNLRRDLNHDEEPHDYLKHLIALSVKSEGEEPRPVQRRSSTATVVARTFSGLQDEVETDPRAAEGTAQDADRLEEEEVGILALDCLKTIFQSQNRVQARGGAIAYMRYLADEEQRYVAVGKITSLEQWAATLFRRITTWTPVHDRFILLVTASETLVRHPLEKTQNFRVAFIYAKVIQSVLRSDLNLIGLSAIDILLALINQTIRLVALASVHSNHNPELRQITTSSSQKPASEELIKYLKDCIANLARHVYYGNQVTDMISFIILRVQATATTNSISKTSSGESRPATKIDGQADGKVSSNDLASSAGRPQTEPKAPSSLRTSTFNTEAGRKLALEIITEIIDVARSSQQFSAGSVVINRNRVPLGVWEGSQWLSRDPSEEVRKAYKEALTMWALNESEEGEKALALIDFDSDDCIERLADKNKPASLQGSTGQSHRSAHPQLLMLPNTVVDRRMSSAKNSSNDTEEVPKPRYKYADLKDVIDGKRFVQPFKSNDDDKPLDVKALLASIPKPKPKQMPFSMEPPNHRPY